MACGCGSDIRGCAPYANLHDVRTVLNSICADCKGTVPFGTDPANFITDGFPNGAGECCQLYFVEVLGQNPGDVSAFYLSSNGTDWAAVGADNAICVVEVPALTPPANFVTVAFGGSVPSSCQTAWVYYDDNSAYFTTTDAGTTWKRVSPINWTTYTRNGATTSTSYVQIGATISVTSIDTAVHISVFGSINIAGVTSTGTAQRFRLDVDGVTVAIFSNHGQGGSIPMNHNISGYYIHPSTVGAATTIQVYVLTTNASETATLASRVQVGL